MPEYKNKLARHPFKEQPLKDKLVFVWWVIKMIGLSTPERIRRPKCHGCFESAPYCACDDYFGSDFADAKWAEMEAKPRWQRLLYRLAGYR